MEIVVEPEFNTFNCKHFLKFLRNPSAWTLGNVRVLAPASESEFSKA